MHFRALSEEKGVTFDGNMVATGEVCVPGVSRDIHLCLVSDDQSTEEVRFKVLSWDVADGKQGTLDLSSISLGKNILRYTPREPGVHKIVLRVAVEGEENALTFCCPLSVEALPSAWQLEGSVNATGNPVLTIVNVPELLQDALWRIQRVRWSAGLQGSTMDRPEQVRCGENTFFCTLRQVVLQEPPRVHFDVQGPDGVCRSATLDLRELCIARLEEIHDGSHLQELSIHNELVREQFPTYQGDYVGAARALAKRELDTLYQTTISLAQATNTQAEQLEDSLIVLRTRETTDLATLETRHRELRDGWEELGISKSILQPMLDMLRNNDQGAIDPWGVLYEALQREQYDAITMAAHLHHPLLAVNRQGDQGKTLLHLAIEQGHMVLCGYLIDRGAAVDASDFTGRTPLQYAVAVNNQEAITLLSASGAVRGLPPAWRVEGSVDAQGNLTLAIADAPEDFRNTLWNIQSIRWSDGLQGSIVGDHGELRHGENILRVVLEQASLDYPYVRLTILGPAGSAKDCQIDLTPLCVAQLSGTTNEGTQRLTGSLMRLNERLRVSEELSTDFDALMRRVDAALGDD